MSFEYWSDDVLLVSLPADLEVSNELGAVVEMVRHKHQCDLVIDFSGVHFVTSATIAELLKLRELLIESGRRLVLSSVSRLIKGVFTVAALGHAFQFADDTSAALKSIEAAEHPIPLSDRREQR
jgi:anti-anti-sigma factor